MAGWDAAPSITSPGIDRNRRATVNASDLLGTTGAVVDLLSGDLVEVSTYYPNGARENLWTNEADVPLEPMGFTGKEADEEIGVTYFGERWLIPRLGRWATPDPLHVHAAGGGEALNSYHYVSGNLLQARDPLGLNQAAIDPGPPDASSPPPPSEQERYQDGRNASQALRDLNDVLQDMNSPVPWVDGGPDLTEVLRRVGLILLYDLEQDADGQWRGSAEALRTHERRRAEDLAYERGYRDAESDFRRERAEQAARDADPLTPFAEIALELLVVGPVAEAGGAALIERGLLEAGGVSLAEVEVGSSVRPGSRVASVASGSDRPPRLELEEYRVLERGEQWTSVQDEMRLQQFLSGREHFLISYHDGTRRIMMAGPNGGTFEVTDDMRRLIAHTHPRVTDPSDFDRDALSRFGSVGPDGQRLGQRSSFLMEPGLPTLRFPAQD